MFYFDIVSELRIPSGCQRNETSLEINFQIVLSRLCKFIIAGFSGIQILLKKIVGSCSDRGLLI